MRKVFLSSTAKDLYAYRDKVAAAINRLDGFKCIRMEEFGARDQRADAFCRSPSRIAISPCSLSACV